MKAIEVKPFGTFADMVKGMDEDTLTDEQVLELLRRKWIEPLCHELTTAPDVIVLKIIQQVDGLEKKYVDTLHQINTEIADAEALLSDMLGRLRGNEYDMAAIAELQATMKNDKTGESAKLLKDICCDFMLPQNGEKVPRIRFKGYDEEWENVSLSTISNKVNEKNSANQYSQVFTNSAEFGIINQRDFFNHDVANSENLNGYYIVQYDDFVYNPRISVTAPFGPINRNLNKSVGVMSPLYYVFRTHDIDTEYLSHFFKTSLWHKFMLLNGNTGARYDRFSIRNTIFEEMPISKPHSELEQHDIALFFTTLDRLVSLRTRQLEKLKALKSGCLQKMFV